MYNKVRRPIFFIYEGYGMKAGIIFSGSSPLFILTSYDSFMDKKFVEKLKTKGVLKCIAFEVPVEMVKEKYGFHFDGIIGDLKQFDDLRVLDDNGHNSMKLFLFKDLVGPAYYE